MAIEMVAPTTLQSKRIQTIWNVQIPDPQSVPLLWLQETENGNNIALSTTSKKRGKKSRSPATPIYYAETATK